MPAGRTSRGVRRPSRTTGAVLAVLMLGLAVWSVAALRPPGARPADAPVIEFSAARAVEHVHRIAAEAHPAGSDAGARVVADLVATLSGLGLDTRVQNAVGAGRYDDGEADLGRVRNVVAVLPGADPTGRLFLVAPHDSAYAGPGAAGAAGVAALLESVRALTAGPPLRNDVVVVLTDGDATCLCGVEAFAASHPLAQGAGVVLHLDARGTTGPAVLVDAAGATSAPGPVLSSAVVELHRALADDSGFDVLTAGGFTGLSTAVLDGAAGTGTPQDLPTRVDPATLQALGETTLATTRTLGDRDLREPAAATATQVTVLGEELSWSSSADRPMAVLAVLSVAGFAWLLTHRGLVWARDMAVGAALALVPLVLAPLAVHGMWALLVAVRPGYAGMADPWRPDGYRLAAVALVLAVVLAWYAVLRGRIGGRVLAWGGLVWLAVLAAVLAVVAPGAAHLAAVPALAGALTGAVCALTTAPAIRVAAVGTGGAVGVVVLVPSIALALPVVGLSDPVLPALAVTALALALLPAAELLFPHPDGADGRTPVVAVPLVAAVVAGACVMAGLFVDRFDGGHPAPSRLAYALDTDGQQAWWVSTDPTPEIYVGDLVDRRGELTLDFPHLAGREVAFGSAERAELAPARVETVYDAVVGGRRELTVRVTPQRPGVRLLALELDTDGGTIARARVAGRGVQDGALGGDRLEVTFHAPPPEGVDASFTVEGGGPVSLRVVDGSSGLDGLPGHRPRPVGIGVAGTPEADLVLVSGTTLLGESPPSGQ